MSEPSEISGAKHLLSRLTAESLQSRAVLRATDGEQVRTLVPDLIVLKVGGSILDRGAEALLAVIGQIAELAPEHRLLVCAGEGARARHAYAIASDLELPPGMLSTLGNAVAEQNAAIITALLMDHGAMHAAVAQIPGFLALGALVVISGMPPYDWWEPPPAGPGRIPEHRSDTGSFLVAEALGARKVIYIKDQDGLRDGDPHADPGAGLIARTTAGALQEREPSELPLEPAVLDMLERARIVEELQLVNGLRPGAVIQAVRGEPIGSIITAR